VEGTKESRGRRVGSIEEAEKLDNSEEVERAGREESRKRKKRWRKQSEKLQKTPFLQCQTIFTKLCMNFAATLNGNTFMISKTT